MGRIDIKLDRSKWGPLLDRMILETLSKNYPEIVKKLLFFSYLYMYEKRSELEGKTQARFVLEHRDIPLSEAHIQFLRCFAEFEKNGKLPAGCKRE